MSAGKIKVGVTVISKKIGAKPQFEGVVVEQVTGGWNVKDEKGPLWLRSSRELIVKVDVKALFA